MIKLIPMAGAGSRFQQEGYSTPKPLIEVLGTPMVVQATQALPSGDNDKYIFICRDFHIADYQIDQAITKHIPNAEFATVSELTEGQACTCLLAREQINNDEELLIAASDNGMLYDPAKFEQAKSEADALVFTFRNNVTVCPKPEQYGWIVTDSEDNATKASVKVPISDTPINDHAIVGAFWFKRGSDFVKAAEDMIAKDRRINGEFYVDEAVNELIEAGLKVKVFEIDKYICWGTPNDLKTFEYWQEFFQQTKVLEQV